MPETCPVCGDAVEHRRTERAGADSAGTAGTAGASLAIDDLCSVEEATRWDRICAAATADGDDGPVLTLYYHFFGDGE